jgi:hypothetical protein
MDITRWGLRRWATSSRAAGGDWSKRYGLAWSGTRVGHRFGSPRAKASNRTSTTATWNVGSAPTRSFRSLHSDFWRVSPQAQFFLIRGYQEDGEIKGIRPGKLFDITLPTWRLGEILLYAASMARQLGAPQAKITIVAEWTGLNGRDLTHLSGTRLLFEGHLSHQDRYRTSLAVQADQIGDMLPELAHRVLHPLYELFDFFQLPMKLVTEELAQMRANQF